MTEQPLPIGAIIAGGEGRRFGASAKALARLDGQPLIAHVIARLRPQTAGLVLSLRRPADWARDLALPTIYDAAVDIGPLAGVAAVLNAVGQAYPDTGSVLTCPVDCPFVPQDLTTALARAKGEKQRVAIARSGERNHYLTALWDVGLAQTAADAAAQRPAPALHEFQSSVGCAIVTWPAAPVDPFLNINTPADLAEAQLCLQRLGKR